MKTYLVGGAVRDALLGRAVTERDWVVVGSTPAAMIEAGFRQVGRDFPVFLHPDSGEEYALARTERKTGPGHTDFECYAAPDVTLEQDLERRDLTINAIAQDDDGVLVDPFGGRRDLQARILRHVSDAFVEDPLRVFRVARLAAVLADFEVAAETLALMRRIAASGELDALSAERVWNEWRKALSGASPGRFLTVLEQAEALAPWFEHVDAATMAELYASRRFASIEAASSALGWCHEAVSVDALMQRLKAPKRFARPARLVARHRVDLSAPLALDGERLLALLSDMGAFRDTQATEVVIQTVEACSGASLAWLREVIEGVRLVRPDTKAEGAEYGRELKKARLGHLDVALAGLRADKRR